MSDLAAILEQGLDEAAVATTGTQRRTLLELAALVDRWSSRINLTGHRGLDAIVRRLILESAALVAVIPDVPTLADLGSGAGFPGLPAAILRPECRVTLVESREKRHHFQRAACRLLGLSNATPVRGRAEQLEPVAHAASIAQALARPQLALPLLVRWVGVGNLVLVPGGEESPVVEDSHVATERVIRYRAPLGGRRRSLWIGRRIA